MSDGSWTTPGGGDDKPPPMGDLSGFVPPAPGAMPPPPPLPGGMPPPGVTATGPPKLESIKGLALAASILVMVQTLLVVFQGFAAFSYASEIDDFFETQQGFQTLEDAENAYIGASGLGLLLLIAAGIVWVIWQQRVRTNLERLGVHDFPHTRGLSVGGWFIPIANLFIPYQVTAANWRGSDDQNPVQSAKQGSVGGIVIAWWAVWLIAGFGGFIVSRQVGSLDSINDFPNYADSLRRAGMLNLLNVPAAVLAVLVVQRISARTRARAARAGATLG